MKTRGLKRRRSDSNESDHTVLPLTQENLGKHDGSFPMSDEPGDATKIFTIGTVTETNKTSSTSSTRTTDAILPSKLRENHVIYGRLNPSQPADFDAVRERLNRGRESMSPTSDDYRHYLRDVESTGNEATLKMTAFNRIKKPPPDDSAVPYLVIVEHKWLAVDQSSLTRGLSTPKPDYAESFAMTGIPTTAVSSLGPYIQPSPYGFSMPKFAVEVEGPNGASVRGLARAAYDGAVMTEAAIAQEKYLGNNQPPYGKTQAITAVFAGGKTVSIHANHAIKGGGVNGTPEYHSSVLFDDMPVASKEDFKTTRRRFRNAQDWAREKSEGTLRGLRSAGPKLVDLTPVDESPVLEPKVSRSKRSKLSHH